VPHLAAPLGHHVPHRRPTTRDLTATRLIDCDTVILTTAVALGVFLSATPADAALFGELRYGRPGLAEGQLAAGANVNAQNAEGLTPLLWLIRHYVDYDVELALRNKQAGERNVEENDRYRRCLKLLLEHGADVSMKTPEGLTALQYAVVLGKWGPTEMLLQKAGTLEKSILDRDGNTLLHLSVLADNDLTPSRFWQNLHDALLSDKVNVRVSNAAGQTPIAFYFSVPRKLSKRTGAMIEVLKSAEALVAPDVKGQTAMDHMRRNSPGFAFSLQLYLDRAIVQKAKHEAFLKKSDERVAENQRVLAEHRRRSEDDGRTLKESFQVEYPFQCDVSENGLFGSRTSEPVTVTVTPTKVRISNLEPHYGAFVVERSGVHLIGGQRWEVYEFEQTSTNSTYKRIGFPQLPGRPRAMLVTSIGRHGMCMP